MMTILLATALSLPAKPAGDGLIDETKRLLKEGRGLVKDIREAIEPFTDLAKDLSKALENLSQATQWGKQLADLITALIDFLKKGENWNDETPAQRRALKNDVLGPLFMAKTGEKSAFDSLIEQIEELIKELEKQIGELDQALNNGKQKKQDARNRENAAERKMKDAKRKKDAADDAGNSAEEERWEKEEERAEKEMEKAKEEADKWDDRIKEAEEKLGELKKLPGELKAKLKEAKEKANALKRHIIPSIIMEFHSLCYQLVYPGQPVTPDALDKYLERLKKIAEENNQTSMGTKDFKNSFQRLGEYCSTMPAGQSQNRLVGGVRTELPARTVATITLNDAVCVQPKVPVKNGASIPFDPKSIAQFTNPQLSPNDLKVSMVEQNGVDEPKLVITNQSSTPTTLDLPPGLLQTTGDGAKFVPLTQTGANPNAITSHLDGVGTYINQLALTGDPIISSNPRWWDYMTRQVSTLVNAFNLDDKKAQEYVETQLKAQLPAEKHKQIPAIAVEVVKRVRQADQAATEDSFDPSTLQELKTTKATVDLRPM